jgi:nucleotide-binding universal stress UspA family protein
MLTVRTILVPVDFTETSDRALDYAVSMAARFEAKVVVLHAYEIPVYGFPDGALVASGEVAGRISEAAQKALDRLVEARQNKGAKLTALLRTGAAYELANTVAEEVDADLIVIGTHGRKGLARALLGSVAENVIRTAKRPVLVIHGPRD